MATMFVLDNPLFRSFAFYSSASVMKMMAMSLLTARHRIGNKAFANPEDFASGSKDKVPVLNHPLVERVRRNHLNDIENIIPFVLLGCFYVATQPTLATAVWHFRIFFFSRIAHTLCYQIPIPQPSRALSFLTGVGVNVSMAVQVIMATL